MIPHSKATQDAAKLSAALTGSAISVPNSIKSRVVDATYADEQGFPMMGGDWLFSLEALTLVGRAMFGSDWDGAEFNALVWSIDPVELFKRELRQQRRNVEDRKYFSKIRSSHDNSRYESAAEFEERKLGDLQRLAESEMELPARVIAVQNLWAKNRDALNRLTKAANWLGDKCRSECIKTGYGAVENLPVISGQSHYWNCVSDIQHWVQNGSLKIFMERTGTMHRCKAYVSRSDLKREMKTLAHSESVVPTTVLGRLPPYLKFAVDLAFSKGWLIDGKQDTGPVREAEVRGNWKSALPDIPMSEKSWVAIAHVLGIPDVKAIKRSIDAAAERKPKK